MAFLGPRICITGCVLNVVLCEPIASLELVYSTGTGTIARSSSLQVTSSTDQDETDPLLFIVNNILRFLIN
jgi:hypothetical protein